MNSNVCLFWKRLAVAMGILCLMASFALAQSDTSQITGIVRDASGALVPNAKVAAVNETTGIERSATTNQDGFYTLTNLPPGPYTVSVEAAGFRKAVSKNNRLSASIPLSVDVSLEVGAVAETVEVTASVATVQADSATVGRTIESQQIANMALNGRNPLLLAQLKPGVRSTSMNRSSRSAWIRPAWRSMAPARRTS